MVSASSNPCFSSIQRYCSLSHCQCWVGPAWPLHACWPQFGELTTTLPTCTGITLWYSALLLLPLSDVVVFGFLTPLIVALLSPLLVKEHPSW